MFKDAISIKSAFQRVHSKSELSPGKFLLLSPRSEVRFSVVNSNLGLNDALSEQILPIQPRIAVQFCNTFVSPVSMAFISEGLGLVRDTVPPWHLGEDAAPYLNRLAGEMKSYNGKYYRIDVPCYLIVPSANYWHWHYQTLMELLLMIDSGLLSNRSILSPMLMEWQQDSLFLLSKYIDARHANFDIDMCLPRDGAIQFRDVVRGSHGLYEPPILTKTPHEMALFDIIRASVSDLAIQRQNLPRRIYISRRDAMLRPLENEAELEDMLQAHGFSVISFTGMAYSDQVSLLSSAEIIVGCHGAGLTNAAFAPRGCHIIEIRQSNYKNQCYAFQSFSRGHNYYLVEGASLNNESSNPNSIESKWKCDVYKIRNLVRSIIQ